MFWNNNKENGCHVREKLVNPWILHLLWGNTWICEVHRVSLSHVWLFVTPWSVAYQAPQSMEFSRQEYWSGSPFPSPGIFPIQGSNPGLPHYRQTLYHLSHQGSPCEVHNSSQICFWCSIVNIQHVPHSYDHGNMRNNRNIMVLKPLCLFSMAV